MRGKVQKWGNSLGLRIPKSLATDTGLVAGSEVDVEVVERRLVVTPVPRPSIRLEELLEGITQDNLHPEFEWGEPVGNEVW